MDRSPDGSSYIVKREEFPNFVNWAVKSGRIAASSAPTWQAALDAGNAELNDLLDMQPVLLRQRAALDDRLQQVAQQKADEDLYYSVYPEERPQTTG